MALSKVSKMTLEDFVQLCMIISFKTVEPALLSWTIWIGTKMSREPKASEQSSKSNTALQLLASRIKLVE